MEIEGEDYEDEDEDTVYEKYKIISCSAADSQKMYAATAYEIVLPYECFAWSDPVPGTGNWWDRVSVNVWLLSVADVTTVKATVSDCHQKLLIWIKLPKIFDYHKLEERNSRMYYYKKSNKPIYPHTHVQSIAQKKALMTLPRDMNNEVWFKQSIFLPFKVSKKKLLCAMGTMA
jgi:hypothetical protein